MVCKETELAIGPVCQCVSVFARGKFDILLADVDTYAITSPLGVIGLGIAVSSDFDDLESNPVTMTQAIGVVRWKIPIDAALYLFTF